MDKNKNKIKTTKYVLVSIFLLAYVTESFSNSREIPNKTETLSNWYVEMGLGGQFYFSKGASRLSFGEHISPAISITGGKWFSPYWGTRIQANGYGFNGYSTTDGIYLNDPLTNSFIYGPNDPARNENKIRPDGSYRRNLRYLNTHIDFQVSLANLVIGYNPSGKWDIIPAVGIGYAHTFAYKGTPNINVVSTNFSLIGKYKFPKGFDLNLEIQNSLFPDQFDGRITGKMYESNLAITLGVTYNFGNRNFNFIKPKKQKREKRPRKIHYVQIINPEILNRVETIKTVVDTVYINKEVKIEKKVPVKNNTPIMLGSILFDIDNDIPSYGQEITFINIVKYLNENPDIKIRLTGYADQQTGTTQYNLHLSVKRSIMVRDILTKKYHIDRKRIEVQGAGIDAQPYEQKKWNRVVIITTVPPSN
ncbi:OmpA family protein [Coprobacter tertius]|uniref:OmpA family protein n=1 Tax=Coprobacter tertius TaxID=2944915 RepID=A0ABT1MCW3_9BACT|nr:OmpA family protein [Coprobacter tertius]MCP9610487.1 OmpA family protein [Coprobacter tertius]